MENLITRHRNVSILVAVLFLQVLGLAIQVKRSTQSEQTRLIRVWTVSTVTPFEKALVWMQQSISNSWHNYLYLRGVRAENRDLKQQIEQMRVEKVRLSEDAEQARRLQILLSFKEKFIAKTVAAQVIGSSGSEQSRSVYIDKGAADGVKTDQAVITADGVVGKVIDVYQDHTAKVLLVNDQSSGVGIVLEKSRLQGILRGTPSGELIVEKILSDESVQPGERVLTSGGDQIFPKGLDVGTVREASPGKDSFLNIRLKPAAALSKLEEVLVITQVEARAPTLAEAGGRVRAADILAERLPSVPAKPAFDPTKPPVSVAGGPVGSTEVANKVSGTGAKSAESPSAQGVAVEQSTSVSAQKPTTKTPAVPESTKNVSDPNTARPQASAAKKTTVPSSAKPAGTVVPTSTHSSSRSLVTGPETAAGEQGTKVTPDASAGEPPKAPEEH